MSESCQLYRHGSLGQTLVDTIDELVVAQKVDPQQARPSSKTSTRSCCADFPSRNQARG